MPRRNDRLRLAFMFCTLLPRPRRRWQLRAYTRGAITVHRLADYIAYRADEWIAELDDLDGHAE